MVDEVDQKVEKSVGWLSQHLAPGAWPRSSCLGGPLLG